MKIFIVLPVFNEKNIIASVLKSLTKTPFRVVIVDDGSKDGTFQKIKNTRLPKSKFTLLKHKINLGKGAAMKTGAEAAFLLGADAVIFMDSDGQHDIKDTNKFVSKLKNYDVVFGERQYDEDTPKLRMYGSKFAAKVVKALFDIEVNDLLCGYRAITKNAYHKIRWDSMGYQVETEMVIRTAKSKIKYKTVPVESVYHDNYKGFTIIDGFRILLSIVRWRFLI